MSRRVRSVGTLAAVVAFAAVIAVLLNGTVTAFAGGKAHARRSFERSLFLAGRKSFRYDTFGDQAFWGGALQLHRAIEGAKLGGVGAGVSPKTALALGLKVDVGALPRRIVRALKAGKVDLNDPATTLALLKLNAVVGVKGFFARNGSLASVGITCAACHSTVDNSFAPGIGHRLDGWPNRDLNVGAIVEAAPNHKPITSLLGVDDATLDKVLSSWGPGKFDAEVFLDGKAFQPNGRSGATLIPPAYGLAGVNLHTFEGWGSVTYWNAFVANLEMHGQGTFFDPRLDDAKKFPIAARNGFGHVRHARDLISPKLPALHYYQLSLPAPKPPKGSYDIAAAARGKAIFDGKGRCSTCHVPPKFTEPGWDMHRPAEICTDSFQADRGPDGMYRTTPLAGLWAHAKGGYYHDGRFADLNAVVDHYDRCFGLGLSAGEKADLVQYLKSL
jgi:hypothetical protein